MNDPDFGDISYGVDAWSGELAWCCVASGTERLRLHIRSGPSGPRTDQRELFRAIKQRYQSLWPQIAARILVLRPDIGDAQTLRTLLNPTLGLSIPGVIDSGPVDFTLVYEFKDDRTRTGYFISVVSWNVVRADVAT